MKYYPFHIGDFRAGTVNMPRKNRWIYRDMLDMYYDTEQPLPLNLDVLCEQLGVESDEERRIVERLLRFKFMKVEDGYHHEKCDLVIAEYRLKAETARENGKAGGRPKQPKPNPEKPGGFLSGSDPVAIGNPVAPGLKANQEPITNNHIINPDGLVVASDADDALSGPGKTKKNPVCPHQAIIALYHEILPMCPRVRDWTPARVRQLRARWNEDPKRQNLDYWLNYFTYVETCAFLVGRGNRGEPFFADLEWLTKLRNFTRVREGMYE